MIGGLPSLAEIESTTVDHLTGLADDFTAQAERIKRCFTQAHDLMGTVPWRGQAYDAAYARSDADRVIAVKEAEQRIEAAGIARRGAENMLLARTAALNAVEQARAADFEVRQDLVANAHTPGRPWEEAVRLQPLANEISAKIRAEAASMVAIDRDTTSKLVTATAGFGTLHFDEAPLHAPGKPNNGIRLVDFFKQGGGPDPAAEVDGGAGGYAPNPNHPGRNNLGHYTGGNTGSADGAAAAEKALKDREEETGIPVIRQQIRVAITDPKTGQPMLDPKTGKPLYRYYDGLEPIPGMPGKYTGIEVKSGSADRTRTQKIFDQAVSADTPARGTLNGKPIEVIDTEKIQAPKFVPPSLTGVDGGAGAGAAGPSGAGPVSAPVISPTPELPTIGEHRPVVLPPVDTSHPPAAVPPMTLDHPPLPPWLQDPSPPGFQISPHQEPPVFDWSVPDSPTLVGPAPSVDLHLPSMPHISAPTPDQLNQAGQQAGPAVGLTAVLALIAAMLSPT